jgi:hypothetical protein
MFSEEPVCGNSSLAGWVMLLIEGSFNAKPFSEHRVTMGTFTE